MCNNITNKSKINVVEKDNKRAFIDMNEVFISDFDNDRNCVYDTHNGLLANRKASDLIPGLIFKVYDVYIDSMDIINDLLIFTFLYYENEPTINIEIGVCEHNLNQSLKSNDILLEIGGIINNTEYFILQFINLREPHKTISFTYTLESYKDVNFSLKYVAVELEKIINKAEKNLIVKQQKNK